MQKLDLKTPDLANENIQKLQALFPEAVKDGKVDCDTLRSLFGEDFEAGQEKFGLYWPGKQEAIRQALKRTQSTLRPKREESKDWDTTQNLFVEGDNLEVLRTLLDTYRGKVKMIYIDPPYNTGNDFVYNDKFKEDKDEYVERSGEAMKSNPQTSGRYHSDWLSMMYPRLRLAREFMLDKGVLFLSIGGAEVANLIEICNEIFGEENRVGIISRMMKSGGNKGHFFSPNIEYILVYAKNILELEQFRLPLENELVDRIYTKIEKEGPKLGERYREMGLCQAGLDVRPNQRYWIKCPDGSLVIPSGTTLPPNKEEGNTIKPKSGDGVWRWIYERYAHELELGNIVFKETDSSPLIDQYNKKSKWNIYTKIWLQDRLDEGRVPTDLITKYENRSSSAELKDLDIPFEFAKPSKLIGYIATFLKWGNEDVILDFFAGSGTSAHATVSLNAENGGNRRYICVQLPEATSEDSEARKAGYQTIADIAKERIRRAGEKIKADFADKLKERSTPLDVGFKVFALDSSNLKEWDSETTDLQASLLDQVNSFKDGRSDEDVLFEVLLRYGVDIAATPIEKKAIGGKTVYDVGAGYLMVCLEKDVDQKTVEAIAQAKPARVVFRDDGFRDDKVKLNAEETLKNIGDLKPENIRVL